MKKYLIYAVCIFAFSGAMWLLSNIAHGNLGWVRAQREGAVRCYQVGQEPKNMKYKHYYSTFDECDKTIGHAV